MKEATVRLLFELEKKCDFDLITRTTKIDRTGTVTRTFDIKTRTTYSRTTVHYAASRILLRKQESLKSFEIGGGEGLGLFGFRVRLPKP